jgi:competence protein ComEA
MRPVLVAVVLVIAILLGVAAQGGKAPRAPVDLNHATVPELMTLPGVGESKAQAIVRYRTSRPFSRTSDLLRVKGIGRNLFARLRPFLTLGPTPAGATPVPGPGVPGDGPSKIWPGAVGVAGRPGTTPATTVGAASAAVTHPR